MFFQQMKASSEGANAADCVSHNTFAARLRSDANLLRDGADPCLLEEIIIYISRIELKSRVLCLPR